EIDQSPEIHDVVAIGHGQLDVCPRASEEAAARAGRVWCGVVISARSRRWFLREDWAWVPGLSIVRTDNAI
ncbi:MAG: hypothetical protein ACI4XG_27665, partial [Bradyrhizobium sp.]